MFPFQDVDPVLSLQTVHCNATGWGTQCDGQRKCLEIALQHYSGWFNKGDFQYTVAALSK